MPFDSVDKLPDRVKRTYGAKGQRAYMRAFNSAWSGSCKDGGRQGDREGCSHAVAQTAAKRADNMEKAAKFLKALVGLVDDVDAVDQTWVRKEGGEWQRVVPITKTDDEKRIAYGPVLEPTTADTADADGDWYTKADIEKAAHRFMRKLGEGEASADGVEHLVKVGAERAHLVESWITDKDDYHGEQFIQKGTWMIGVHLPDDELWKEVKSGGFTGFSIGGRGTREGE